MDGYGQVDTRCLQCADSEAQAAALAVFLCGLVAFFAFSAHKAAAAAGSVRLAADVVPVLKILLTYATLVLTLSAVDVDWSLSLRGLQGVEEWIAAVASQPGRDRSSLSALRSTDCVVRLLFGSESGPAAVVNATSADVAASAASAEARREQTLSLALVLALPALCIAAVLLLLACVRVLSRLCSRAASSSSSQQQPFELLPGASLSDAAVIATIVVVNSQHFAVAQSTLEVLSCIADNERSYLARNTALVCWSGDHLALMWLAAPGFAVFVVGYAAALSWVLARNRSALHQYANRSLDRVVPFQ